MLIACAMPNCEQAVASAFSPSGWTVLPREVGDAKMGDETGWWRRVVLMEMLETSVRTRGRRVIRLYAALLRV